MNTHQLSDFSAAAKADWRAQVSRELKAERDHDALRWPLPNGFVLDAYYTADDLSNLPLDAIQSAQKSQPGWLNTPEYDVHSEAAEQNEILQKCLATGADALLLNVPPEWPVDKLSRLLHGIKLSETPVFFELAANVVSFVESLKIVAPYRLKGGILAGNSVSAAQLADITQLTTDSPQFRTVGISSHDFHNAGATATQELAFLLARLAERCAALTQAGLSPNLFIPKIWLSVSIGTSYFVEMAKLRALQVLFQRFLATSDGHLPTHDSVFIHARTSTFYDAAVTPYTNLLRATTEAMSATIGGCDALTVTPFDAVLQQHNAPEFSQRMARNVSLLLAEEGYMNKVADPSAGSYYVETLTHELIETAWTLFEQVQALGGLSSAFDTGFLQAEIERAYQARIDAVKSGRVLVGVTKYRHDEADIRQLTSAVAGQLPGQRLAQPFE